MAGDDRECPDWQRLYYVLALRVVTAQGALAAGDSGTARQSLDIAARAINSLESPTATETAETLRVC